MGCGLIAKIAIGARSCIFAPLDNVGLIVVDEEHDTSYFSESNPRYYTHTVARYLAYLHDCPLVLGSATPSIDSYNNAKEGIYRLLELPVRANNKELPQIQIVYKLSEIRNGNDGI
ncbi:MAG: primosomal protein N', partial [Firmicutes bacterium]|nr:primosomal protein N' [Bacillota bacterium]